MNVTIALNYIAIMHLKKSNNDNSAYEISHKQSLIKFNNVGLIRLNRFLPNSLAKNKALTPFLVN